MKQKSNQITTFVFGALAILAGTVAVILPNIFSGEPAVGATPVDLKLSPQPYPVQGISIPPKPVSSSSSNVVDDLTGKPVEHTHRVSGQFQFEYQVGLLVNAQQSPLFPWKATVTNTPQSRLVRDAVVILEDECGHYIKRKISSNGDFSFEWTPVGCNKGKITVWSVAPGNKADKVGVGKWLKGPVNTMDELTSNTSDYIPYSFSHSFDIKPARKNGGNDLDLGKITIPLNDEASRGFFIMDNVLIARSYYSSLPGISDTKLVKINVVHSKGLKPRGLECDAWDAKEKNLQSAIYVPTKDLGFIFIPWDCNDLGQDAHAHIHETSHYFQRLFLRQNPDYGRFGEGLANVQSAIIRKSQWITTTGTDLVENLDVNARMACWNGTEWNPRIDTPSQFNECTNSGGIPGFPQAVVWSNNLASAGWFQRIVWDLVDGGTSEPEPLTTFIIPNQSPNNCGNACEFGQFDKITGSGTSTPPSSLAINDVLIYYLGGNGALGTNPNYVDRGLPGLDITDFLDGMICRGHISASAANELVATAMGLNYEAEGSPTSCPHPLD
ncbi:MAG: hypothetical protein KME28_05885 [Pelatocladus maniniholoensis HA4357-MV3]|jgi:hypothetical protein|uniref:Uncharacterized protein n=1 Tax=Pelatocladus maniniholoensis HA4357-MV3 TaxID=1117104 RepID=A0A9E3H5P8_9NOST|nr:hypothetical protein [Pelatocladus maniniholoensis HA4357-MV3]